ncbi:Gfo/Idh/MocA family oxidoreductase [Microlunatus panaciterrae]|uniref:Myo-inositol 2-dehydrogenase/D-chiro-inositol 1-dehydrogenase n=1 Tax=Microlunatus panaciterrae TaxID=400768 RepID=A0ABS2RH57_9ACTN|nr:Gfo/Idh/MocA family oxidoreductase [Microlunatus panaciterrae]MBM7798344.1 myo-inositol 2-dehydrogenase/D-chiro-inositol 1-dehydrogenase [Microlunatus panaciterrae]
MRIGVIGLGGISAAHLAAWEVVGQEMDLEIHGYDHLPEKPVPAGVTPHDSLESILSAVDVVDICTPSYTHPEIIRAAADAGLRIICEKPLALTVAEAVDTLRYCRERDVPLQIGQVVRFFGEYESAHRAVSTGEYGEPAVLRFRRASAQPRSNEWMHDEALSGGIAVDLMIHDIDQAIWFAGDVERVFAQAGLPKYGGAQTQAYATLTHTSGALTQLNACWGLAGGFETSFEIACTDGIINHDNQDHSSLRADRPDLLGTAGLLPVMAGATPFAAELKELLAAVAFGAPSRVDPVDAIAALSVAIAVRESARTGQAQVPEPLPSDMQRSATSWQAMAGATW